MKEYLEGLIPRIETLTSGDKRSLYLHWSDVESLKLVLEEMEEIERQNRTLKETISHLAGFRSTPNQD